MEEGQIIVPALIAIAVGIFVGTRIWILFKK
jgi:bifunctional DNA-binding transcriptional regulator/antitoxin component of YhaV-PrlF toxin-antitoxin module